MANSRKSLHVKTGDRVIVTAGKDKGKQGNIKKAMPSEGKVVVEIQVNEKGNVVSANYSEGTTITDKYTIQLAIDAALRAKFSPSSNKLQVGTITYTFKLN